MKYEFENVFCVEKKAAKLKHIGKVKVGKVKKREDCMILTCEDV